MYVCVNDVRVSDVCVSDVGVSDVCVSDVCVSDVCVSDVCVSDVCVSDVCVSERINECARLVKCVCERETGRERKRVSMGVIRIFKQQKKSAVHIISCYHFLLYIYTHIYSHIYTYTHTYTYSRAHTQGCHFLTCRNVAHTQTCHIS